jgi:uncharacterized protein YndB with AHSA1/START domain
MTFERESNDAPVYVAVAVAAPVSEVWRALTEERARWWPDLVFDAVVAAPVTETWRENGRHRVAWGSVIEVVAPRALAFIWFEPGWTASLTVRFTVGATGGTGGTDGRTTTTVTVTETGFHHLADGAALREEHADGWRTHLASLRTAVDG